MVTGRPSPSRETSDIYGFTLSSDRTRFYEHFNYKYILGLRNNIYCILKYTLIVNLWGLVIIVNVYQLLSYV